MSVVYGSCGLLATKDDHVVVGRMRGCQMGFAEAGRARVWPGRRLLALEAMAPVGGSAWWWHALGQAMAAQLEARQRGGDAPAR
jgi:hypothetical protein